MKLGLKKSVRILFLIIIKFLLHIDLSPHFSDFVGFKRFLALRDGSYIGMRIQWPLSLRLYSIKLNSKR